MSIMNKKNSNDTNEFCKKINNIIVVNSHDQSKTEKKD